MGEKSSIHYIMAHEKIRNLIFEEWERTNLLLNQGPDVLKQYFCKLWNETKQELEYVDDIDIIDLDKKIKTEDFNVTYSILGDGIKTFNFIMPKPLTDYGQALYISVVLTSRIPRFFTLELVKGLNGNDSYMIGEWYIDFENDNYEYKNYETIDKPNIGEFLGKINKILNR